MNRVSKSLPRTVSVLVVLALVATSALVLIGQALAQTSTVQFLNPSGYSAKVVSDQPDGGVCTPGAANGYHLVAWVGNPQAGQQLEFEYQRFGERAVAIGFASLNADTFETCWDVPDTLTGTVTLRAILYQSNVEVARDEEQVEVNNTAETPTNLSGDAETLEITYPRNGQQDGLGVFSPPGRPAAFLMDVTVSPGTNWVSAFYTVSARGTEPNWKSCGAARQVNSQSGFTFSNTGAGSGTIRCTIAAGDQPLSITGVAAVTNDTPNPLAFNASFSDSGDAHRAFPYGQTPTSLALSAFGSLAGVTVNECSPVIRTSVIDQANRRIPGINIDVHASGPDDSLAFDASRNFDPNANPNDPRPDQNQAPDSNHASSEPAQNCLPEPETLGGGQGRHNRVNTDDIKHIESTQTADEDGFFDFRLFSAAAGTTKFTAWAEITDDDLFCFGEPGANSTVTWGSDAAANGVPEDIPSDVQGCPAPPPPPPPPSRTLTVTKSGTGSGTVTSSPAGISCGNDCTESYANGTSVTLTANADSGSSFNGFTGCDSVSGNQCTVAMNADRTVTASFVPSAGNRTLTVTKSGTGTGTVTSSPPGVNCGNDCSESYANGTSVTLTATSSSNSFFAGFTGCDSVAGNECTVNMNADRTVNATFNSTQSPTPTQTTVPPTATQTQSPSPGFFARSVQLESSHSRRRFGAGFTLSATVSPQTVGTPTSCIQGVIVSLQRTIVGETASTLVGTATTNSSGTANFNLTADRSANYVATVAQSGTCSGATSESEPVLVRKKVALRLSQQRARPGTTIRIIATVTPCDGHEGDDINLFKVVGGSRLQTGSKASNFNCSATFQKRVRRNTVFQAISPKQDSDHLRGTSPRRGVSVT